MTASTTTPATCTKFIIEGEEYDVERFNIKVYNPTEGAGSALIHVSLLQFPTGNLFRWAKEGERMGKIIVMEDTGKPVFEVEFQKAVPVEFSVNLKAETDRFTLELSTQYVKINGIESNFASLS
jgi:hypothetical protein